MNGARRIQISWAEVELDSFTSSFSPLKGLFISEKSNYRYGNSPPYFPKHKYICKKKNNNAEKQLRGILKSRRSFATGTHDAVVSSACLLFFPPRAKYIFRLWAERQNKCCIRINLPRVMTLKSLFDLQGLVNLRGCPQRGWRSPSTGWEWEDSQHPV